MTTDREAIENRQNVEKLALVESDKQAVDVFMSDGSRVLDTNVDQVVRATARTREAEAKENHLLELLQGAQRLIGNTLAEVPTVKRFRISVYGGYALKVRVVVITKGEYFDEVASEAVEELTAQLYEMDEQSRFNFQFFVQPESVEETTISTFVPDSRHIFFDATRQEPGRSESA